MRRRYLFCACPHCAHCCFRTFCSSTHRCHCRYSRNSWFCTPFRMEEKRHPQAQPLHREGEKKCCTPFTSGQKQLFLKKAAFTNLEAEEKSPGSPIPPKPLLKGFNCKLVLSDGFCTDKLRYCERFSMWKSNGGLFVRTPTGLIHTLVPLSVHSTTTDLLLSAMCQCSVAIGNDGENDIATS